LVTVFAAASDGVAESGPQRPLEELPTYAGAERAVDRLSDKGFPVEHTRIVGTGLRTVDYTFRNGSAFGVAILAGTAIGMSWGAAFGYLAHRATRGRRDFNSVKGIEAKKYAVYVDSAHTDEALRLSVLH
jgi:hypothetical protein